MSANHRNHDDKQREPLPTVEQAKQGTFIDGLQHCVRMLRLNGFEKSAKAVEFQLRLMGEETITSSAIGPFGGNLGPHVTGAAPQVPNGEFGFVGKFDCHYDGDINRCDKNCRELGECKRRTSGVRSSTEAMTANQVRHQVIRAAHKPSPMCRDCADRDGTCHDGTKCDPFEAALDVLRAHASGVSSATLPLDALTLELAEEIFGGWIEPVSNISFPEQAYRCQHCERGLPPDGIAYWMDFDHAPGCIVRKARAYLLQHKPSVVTPMATTDGTVTKGKT